MELAGLEAYQCYVIQASAKNYYMDQWKEEPVRGRVFKFRTRPGSKFTR